MRCPGCGEKECCGADYSNTCDALQKELDEQCRLNGMGAQRELKLMTERDKAIQDMNLAVSNAGKDLIAERDRYRQALQEIAKPCPVIEDAQFEICTCDEAGVMQGSTVRRRNLAREALQTHEKE